MAGSGNVVADTFTPNVACKVVVSCSYDAYVYGGGSDWGLSGDAGYAKLFLTQDGSTAYGPERSFSTTRMRHTLVWSFDVAANQEVTCGLFGRASGICACSFYNADLRLELIKR